MTVSGRPWQLALILHQGAWGRDSKRLGGELMSRSFPAVNDVPFVPVRVISWPSAELGLHATVSDG